MRLKVILFMLTLGLLGGLSACSSEEPIDSQTLDMSLVLLMGDIQTKASAPNYKYATTEEIMIQNCHVAFLTRVEIVSIFRILRIWEI